MGIEYNECHYCGMYNVYVKRIFVITEFVHMIETKGIGVNYMKEKVKESQSRSVTPSLDTHSGAWLGASQNVRINGRLIIKSSHVKDLDYSPIL